MLKSLQLCPILCHPIVSSPPGSSVHGILQARILEWVVISSCNLDNPEIKPVSLTSPALASGFLTTGTAWEALLLSLGPWQLWFSLYLDLEEVNEELILERGKG